VFSKSTITVFDKAFAVMHDGRGQYMGRRFLHYSPLSFMIDGFQFQPLHLKKK